MDLVITILPVVTKDLPISPRFTPYDSLSRCKFSNLTTRQPMVEFYLLTFPCFPLRKKEHKSYFDKNRTHDFRTSRCADYLLNHSAVNCKCISLYQLQYYNIAYVCPHCIRVDGTNTVYYYKRFRQKGVHFPVFAPKRGTPRKRKNEATVPPGRPLFLVMSYEYKYVFRDDAKRTKA